MIPADLLAQIKNRKHGKDAQRDDFLHAFELGGGIILVPDSVGGDLQAVFENAIPQLTKITTHSEVDLNFKCPYHAKVIKMFEQINRTTGKTACIFQNSVLK